MPDIIVLFTFIAACTVSFLSADSQNLQYEMRENGYEFNSSYQIRFPSSKRLSSKHIVINASSGPSIGSNVVFAATDRPFKVALRRKSKKTKKECGLNAGGANGQIGITKININSSSPMYTAFKKLLNKIVLKYDIAAKQRPLYNNKPISVKEAKKIRVKALAETSLLAQYYIKITSDLTPNFPYNKTAQVDSYATSEVIKGQKIITIKVGSFRRLKSQNQVFLKFVSNRKGLKVLTRKNIDRTSPWYRICEDAAKKTLDKYIELTVKHNEHKKLNAS